MCTKCHLRTETSMEIETQIVWVMCKLTICQSKTDPLWGLQDLQNQSCWGAPGFLSCWLDNPSCTGSSVSCFQMWVLCLFSACAGKCALRRHNPPHPFHQFGAHEVSTEERHWFQRLRGVQKCHVLPGQWWQAQLSLASVPLVLLRKRQGKFDHSHNLRPTWCPFDRHVPSPPLGSWCLLGHGYLPRQWQLWRPHPKRAWRICHNMSSKFCQHQIEVDPCKERHSESYKWRVEVWIQMQARVSMCSKLWIQMTREMCTFHLSITSQKFNMIHNPYMFILYHYGLAMIWYHTRCWWWSGYLGPSWCAMRPSLEGNAVRCHADCLAFGGGSATGVEGTCLVWNVPNDIRRSAWSTCKDVGEA